MDAALRTALAEAARSETLLVACDYDGTLSPLVDDPDSAVPHAPAMAALHGLSAAPGTHVVLVSGRSVDTLRRLSGAPDRIALIGSHGAEMPAMAVPSPPGLAALHADLESIADDHPGAQFEPKPLGGAFHFRHVADKTSAADAARRVATAHDAHVVDGKMVVEVMLDRADKGSALRAWQRHLGTECVVFFGDDTTDESVFGLLEGGDVGVKVGDGPSAAAFRVADPEEVGRALHWLGEQRQSL